MAVALVERRNIFDGTHVQTHFSVASMILWNHSVARMKFSQIFSNKRAAVGVKGRKVRLRNEKSQKSEERENMGSTGV